MAELQVGDCVYCFGFAYGAEKFEVIRVTKTQAVIINLDNKQKEIKIPRNIGDWGVDEIGSRVDKDKYRHVTYYPHTKNREYEYIRHKLIQAFKEINPNSLNNEDLSAIIKIAKK